MSNRGTARMVAMVGRLWVCSVFALVAILASATRAQDAPRPSAPQDAAALQDKEIAERRIAELGAATEPDEATRSRLIEQYRQVLLRVKSELDDRRRTETFGAALESASPQAARLRSELAASEAAERGEPTRPADATSEVLQQQVTQAQIEVSGLRSQIETADHDLAELADQLVKGPARATEARETLLRIEAELAALAKPSPDAPETERAAYMLLIARQRARTVEIATLEQERLSSPARKELIEAERALAAWKLARAAERETRLESWTSEVRQLEAEQARAEAERLRRAALDKHPLIQALVAGIAEVTLENETYLPKINLAREQRKTVEARLAQTNADYEQTKLSLQLGITRALGTALLEQRRSLPNERGFRRATDRRSDDAAGVRLRLFGLERQLRDIDGADAVDRLVQDPSAPALSAADQADVRAELQTLLTKKREYLQRLQTTLKDYLTAVLNLETQERALLARSRELAAVLDERLIWIPDAEALGISALTRIPRDVQWLFGDSLWSGAWPALRADLESFYSVYGLGAVLLGALVLFRRRLRRRLSVLAVRVSSLRTDRIGSTMEALAIQLIDTSQVPGALAILGWRASVAADSTDASKAVGAGLGTAAILLFSIQFVRNLFREQGTALAHFRWSERSGKLIRRHLLWYAAVAVPLAFVVTVTQAHTDPLIRHGLGRSAFVLGLIAASVLATILLDPKGGIFPRSAVDPEAKWTRKTRSLWKPVGITVPLVLAVLAGAGFYYAALELDTRLNLTVVILLTAVIVHALLLRWLKVSQRRLAMRVALERRAAQAAMEEAGDVEESVAAEGVFDTLERIDVAEIKEQTQDLLRVSIAALAVTATWFAWVGVLPALGVLDDVSLWSREAMIDGAIAEVPVTLANLGLALLAVIITVTAARNMPGFLEIAVLQRLPLDTGVRYATRTLVMYAIVTVGVIIAFNAIGVGWSSVQWLVAALTVGLGFGLQEIFANFVSGIIILIERPIRVGDTVTVAGTSGVVTRIRMRATTITDWSRRELLVPNRSFITGELINWSLSDPILRLEFPIGIAYGSDTTLAHKTMLEVCRSHPMVLSQPESNVFFVGFGDNSLNFDARVFVSEPTNTGRSRILHDLHMAIDKACREKNITIAFPQRDLHLKTADAVLRVAIERPAE